MNRLYIVLLMRRHSPKRNCFWHCRSILLIERIVASLYFSMRLKSVLQFVAHQALIIIRRVCFDLRMHRPNRHLIAFQVHSYCLPKHSKIDAYCIRARLLTRYSISFRFVIIIHDFCWLLCDSVNCLQTISNIFNGSSCAFRREVSNSLPINERNERACRVTGLL